MKCAQHPDIDAVGTCNSCDKGLCHECASIFSLPICGDCALVHNKKISTSLWIQLALMGTLFVTAMAMLVGKIPLTTAIGYSLVAAFFPPGWNFLNHYFAPGGGYLFPMARWMNLFVHAVIAATIGLVVGPIYLIKSWKELQTARKLESSIGNR